MAECCGCERKQWAFILGCVIFTISLIAALVFFIIVLVRGKKDLSEKFLTVLYIVFPIYIVIALVEIGFCSVLIIGAKRCSRLMLNIWVWAGIFFCVFHGIFGFVVHFAVNSSGVYIATGLILFVLYICALVTVWPLRDECKALAGPAGQSKARNTSGKSTGKGTTSKAQSQRKSSAKSTGKGTTGQSKAQSPRKTTDKSTGKGTVGAGQSKAQSQRNSTAKSSGKGTAGQSKAQSPRKTADKSTGKGTAGTGQSKAQSQKNSSAKSTGKGTVNSTAKG